MIVWQDIKRIPTGTQVGYTGPKNNEPFSFVEVNDSQMKVRLPVTGKVRSISRERFEEVAPFINEGKPIPPEIKRNNFHISYIRGLIQLIKRTYSRH